MEGISRRNLLLRTSIKPLMNSVLASTLDPPSSSKFWINRERNPLCSCTIFLVWWRGHSGLSNLFVAFFPEKWYLNLLMRGANIMSITQSVSPSEGSKGVEAAACWVDWSCCILDCKTNKSVKERPSRVKSVLVVFLSVAVDLLSGGSLDRDVRKSMVEVGMLMGEGQPNRSKQAVNALQCQGH